jgi:hypothetical protein
VQEVIFATTMTRAETKELCIITLMKVLRRSDKSSGAAD